MMASASHQVFICYGNLVNRNRSDQQKTKQKVHSLKINGIKRLSVTNKVDLLGHEHPPSIATSLDDSYEDAIVLEQQSRQKIPTKKQLIDPYRQGVIIDEEGIRYRQTVVIRSYEVGPDKTATIETILNLLQETALNHVWMSGLLSDGFGATHGMMRNNLIWVISRMQIQVDHYPIWGEVMEIDTWVGASGKNGMRRDWVIKSQATGLEFARATSTWVMMNQETRRLSKMPDEVRAEISPWFIEKQAICEEIPEKIDKLDYNNASYVHSDLKPRRTDLDMNHHVNNVKYVRWMLETIPDEFLKNNQLCGMVLEYRRECKSSDVVQSLCEPQDEDDGLLKTGLGVIKKGQVTSLASDFLEAKGILMSINRRSLSYTHLLQTKGDLKNEEIVRGKTTWKKKISVPFPP